MNYNYEFHAAGPNYNNVQPLNVFPFLFPPNAARLELCPPVVGYNAAFVFP